MKLTINLGGTQTNTHCSGTSSINACRKLDCVNEKCLLFRNKLEYDYEFHAYIRCTACKDAETIKFKDLPKETQAFILASSMLIDKVEMSLDDSLIQDDYGIQKRLEVLQDKYNAMKKILD